MEATESQLRRSSGSERRLSDAWTAHGLPSNSTLSSLPPLPVTPATKPSFQDPYLSLHRSRPFRELLESATERSKTPAHGPPISATPRSVIHKVDPHYPVLSARQSSSNLARDVKISSRSGARSPLAEMRIREAVDIPLPESPQVGMSSMRILESPPPSRPAASGSTPPAPVTLDSASTRCRVPKIATPSPPSSRSGSFQLPAEFPEVSNLLDASMGFGRESIGNETFDLDIASLRPKPILRTVSSTPASGSVRFKRTLPPSQFLAVVGEEKNVLDQSTLLPTSPMKNQDLLKDMITNESFLEEPSMYLPPPPASVRKTPRKPAHEADVTVDIQTLMSKVRKPKRASGTEESFVDLLHGGEPSMMDMCVSSLSIGGAYDRLADDSFLPASIRWDPRKAKSTPRLSNGSPKTMAGQLASYPSTIKGSPADPVTDRKTAYSPAKTSPIKTLPDRQSAYSSRATTMTIIKSSPPRITPRRQAAPTPSKTHIPYSPTAPKTPLIPDRQMAYPTSTRTPRLAMHPSALIPDRQLAFPSPNKLTTSPTRSKAPEAAVVDMLSQTPRGRRTHTTPHTNRRISLSAGPVPMTTSASVKKINLPRSTTREDVKLESMRSPTRSSGLPAKISAEIEVAKGHQRARYTGSALVVGGTPLQTVPWGLPRPRSSVVPSKGSALPAPRISVAPRPELKARNGSTPAATIARAETAAKASEKERASIPAKTSTRPGLPLPIQSAARPAMTSTTAARMDQIRSKIASTRTFGADAGPKLNSTGLPRPTTAATTSKSKAMSTPASAPARTTRVGESSLSKPAASTSIPSRTSALPKSTRLPTTSAGKGSLPPPSGSSAGLASIRERLDKLQARQQATRGAR